MKPSSIGEGPPLLLEDLEDQVVLDASALVAALVDSGPEGRWATGFVLDRALAAPSLVEVETTNILRRLELSGRLPAPSATQAHRQLLSLDLALFPFEPFAERVWELRRNVTSYDACYVAVAEAIGAPLATLDRKLARTAGPRCRFLLPAERRRAVRIVSRLPAQ